MPSALRSADLAGAVAERRRERQRGSNAGTASPARRLRRARRANALERIELALAVAKRARRTPGGLPCLRRLGRATPAFEDGRDAGPHLGFDSWSSSCANNCAASGGTATLPRPGRGRASTSAERSAAIAPAIRVAGAPAQIDRASVRLERGVDASLLQIDVRDRREVKGAWNRQQVGQRDLVAPMQAVEGVGRDRRGRDRRWRACAARRPASTGSGRAPASPALLRGWSARPVVAHRPSGCIPRLARSTATVRSSPALPVDGERAPGDRPAHRRGALRASAAGRCCGARCARAQRLRARG